MPDTVRVLLRVVATIALFGWVAFVWSVPDAVLSPYLIAGVIVTVVLFAVTLRLSEGRRT